MRTFWQRLQYKNGSFRYDYMGNAEYEFGSIPRALEYLAALPEFVTKGYNKPFQLEIYPKEKRPKRFVFVGELTKIEAFVAEASQFMMIENKAGYGSAPVWLPVDPRDYGDEPGFVVINVDYLQEHGIPFEEILDAVILNFGLSNSKQKVTEQ